MSIRDSKLPLGVRGSAVYSQAVFPSLETPTTRPSRNKGSKITGLHGLIDLPSSALLFGRSTVLSDGFKTKDTEARSSLEEHSRGG